MLVGKCWVERTSTFVLNNLQKMLRGFVKDPLLLGCPHLLQVRTVLGFEIRLLIFCACVVLW